MASRTVACLTAAFGILIASCQSDAPEPVPTGLDQDRSQEARHTEPLNEPLEPGASTNTIGFIVDDGILAKVQQVSAASHRNLSPSIKDSQRWQRMSWLGQLHTAILLEGERNRDRLEGANAAAKCAFIRDVTQKYTERLQRERGLFDDESAAEIAIAAVRATPTCQNEGLLSVFGRRSWVVPRIAHKEMMDTFVTTAAASHINSLTSQMETVAYITDVDTRINSVLATAEGAGLSEADLNAIYGAAAVDLDSAYYWYYYDMDGGFDEPPPLSIFRNPFFVKKSWLAGLATDAIGCAAAALDKIYLTSTPVGAGVVAGACGIWGGAASLGYAIS
jgi:hypothetical protein